MKKGLIRKIGIGIVLPLAFVLNNCGKVYEIDGNEIKLEKNDSYFVLRETLNKEKMKNSYFFESNDKERKLISFDTRSISFLDFKNMNYSEEDTLIFQKAKARATYLFAKIDSIEVAREEKQDQEQKQTRIDYGLKALR